MIKKRDKLRIIYDILHAVREKGGRIKPTHLLYKSNLSHQVLKEYLKDLIGRGFMEEVSERKSKNRFYTLTGRGHEYLNQYRMIKDFMDTFGIE